MRGIRRAGPRLPPLIAAAARTVPRPLPIPPPAPLRDLIAVLDLPPDPRTRLARPGLATLRLQGLPAGT